MVPGKNTSVWVFFADGGRYQRMDPKNLSIGGFGGFGWVPKCMIPRYPIGPKFKCRRGWQVETIARN